MSQIEPLWTAEDVGRYLAKSTKTVLQSVRYLPGFPAAVKLPSAKRGGQPRWVGAEVQEWALSHRETA